MTIQSQYLRGAGYAVLAAGESGVLMAGPKFASPELGREVASHDTKDVTPELGVEIAVT